MFKNKSQIKKLGLVVALGLLSGTASAISIYDTTEFTTSGGASLIPGDWAAGRFTASSPECPNGCDVTDVSLSLFDEDVDFDLTAPLAGLTLSVYSDGGDGTSLGSKQFSFDIASKEVGGDIRTVNFLVNDGEDSFVAKNTYYWLRLDNISRESDIAWNYDGFGFGEYQVSFESGVDISAEIPFLFEVNGIPSEASPVPVPGAVWMMGSGLLGLLAASRRKSNKLA